MKITPEIMAGDVIELLQRINLDAHDTLWVSQCYKQGISLGQPYYSDGGFEIEVSFKGGADGFKPEEFDRFLDNNSINYSKSCGLSRLIVFNDEYDCLAFYEKLALLMYAGNTITLKR